ncbi:MAG TPA: FkbM family methyltransferase [Desulfuromonadaceae bacterium]|jgi:FkbM family methyltransferase
MLSKAINFLKTLIRNRLPNGRLSYSQEGEDLVLVRILDELKISKGFFVDIGAHHPTRFSNTYYFYRRGWRGINVDALPGTKKLFQRMRPRDITIECGVGAQEGALRYFAFNESALNTFSEHEARKKDCPPYHIINTLQIPVVTLKQILDKNLPRGTQIDFMTIDAEGFDHEVVSSNDWNMYRPRVVLVELLNTEIQNLESHPTAKMLSRHNYRALAKTYNTYFFVANEAFTQNG